eukprot:TRINITY_DN2420_c1_g1_i3.p1 TRINITY_DN2420_c1_g1~~TRINITY_DN2420_c1_g1_i3.p1  ORF type:complete len:1208 (-),score=202.03 TRINITY_DN2420_c1_g1_i3:338-3961(-)
MSCQDADLAPLMERDSLDSLDLEEQESQSSAVVREVLDANALSGRPRWMLLGAFAGAAILAGAIIAPRFHAAHDSRLAASDIHREYEVALDLPATGAVERPPSKPAGDGKIWKHVQTDGQWMWKPVPSGGGDEHVAQGGAYSVKWNCDAALNNFKLAWSQMKKDWCCTNEKKGCESGTNEAEFDCDAALNNFRAAWSRAKKDWCCAQQKKGCESSVMDSSNVVDFDCDAALNNFHKAWSQAKKDWCCAKQKKGCESGNGDSGNEAGFDCDAALNNFQKAWSPAKKDWCCANKKKGCEPASAMTGGSGTASIVPEQHVSTVPEQHVSISYQDAGGMSSKAPVSSVRKVNGKDVKFTIADPKISGECCRHFSSKNCCLLHSKEVCWNATQEPMRPCCSVESVKPSPIMFEDEGDLKTVQDFFLDRRQNGLNVSIVDTPSSYNVEWKRGQLWFGFWNVTCKGYNWHDSVTVDEFFKHHGALPEESDLGQTHAIFVQFNHPYTTQDFHDCLVGPVFENCGKVKPCGLYTTTTTTTTPKTCEIFTCPAGYEKKNSESTDYSQANCCEATCTVFTCPSGYAKKMNASLPYTQENCCQATCTAFTCPSGYEKKMNASLPYTQDNCCQATCAVFTCPSGYSKKAKAVTPYSEENCCEATCTEFTCPSGYAKKTDATLPYTKDNCCQATCAVYTCPSTYAKKANASAVVPTSKANCCQETCQAFTCPFGYEKRMNATLPYTKENCCQATCTAFTCPSGYEKKMNASLPYTQDNCCQATCAVFTCPSGYAKKAKAVTPYSKENCCEATCTEFTCPAGYAKKTDATLPYTKDNCCQETCAAYTCPSSYAKKANASAVAPASNANCCQATCAAFTCPHGYEKRINATLPYTEENCCQATCEVFTCPHGYIKKVTATTPYSKENCCQVTCEAFTCQPGYEKKSKPVAPYSESNCCQATTTTTTTPTPSSCQLWGDPHIITFDKSQFVFYRSGDFWIVKSDAVKIQGRFQATDWTKANDHTDYSSMTDIIISGSALSDHKIEVQPYSETGQILCDDKPILKEFGESACAGAQVYYSDKGQLVDSAMAFLPHRVVQIQLPSGVHVQVNRWPNFLNAKVTMVAVPGQDGVCGNFNGDKNDDTGKMVHSRFGSGVARSELLFSKPTPLLIPKINPSVQKCPPEVRQKAEAICAQEMKDAKDWGEEECVGDACALTMESLKQHGA